MRWDDQKVERERGRSLPGLDVERVRTFDAPEALGINFHEVRAKSALNKVPGSYLPFNYTVNAFRGCSHACTYCAWGETPVLLANGRTKPLADLEVGERIYGTLRGPKYRRYEVTEVLAHWRPTRRPSASPSKTARSWSRVAIIASGPAAANGSTWSALSGVHFSDHI